MSIHDIPSDIEEAAKFCAGNHRKFESFGWSSRPEDDENWMITSTSCRDSDIAEESNEHVILENLESFMEGDDPDVVQECHSHWGVGYINALVIRVFRDGEITEAFKEWHSMMLSLADYPLLDDSDYSQRTYDAQHEAIEQSAPSEGDAERPENWVNQVWKWFWDNDQECSLFQEPDDPYIGEDEIKKAMDDLGIAYDRD